MQSTETTVRRRPLGITILAIIIGIFGILALLAVILGIVAFTVLVNNKAVDTVAIILLIVGGIIAIAEIAVAWGLWTLKRWAFWTAVVVEIVNIINALYSWLGKNNNGAILSLVIAAAILIYLFADRNVRAAFHV